MLTVVDLGVAAIKIPPDDSLLVYLDSGFDVAAYFPVILRNRVDSPVPVCPSNRIVLGLGKDSSSSLAAEHVTAKSVMVFCGKNGVSRRWISDGTATKSCGVEISFGFLQLTNTSIRH
jgi:hypothetical protein